MRKMIALFVEKNQQYSTMIYSKTAVALLLVVVFWATITGIFIRVKEWKAGIEEWQV